jgi:hypothetical protein
MSNRAREEGRGVRLLLLVLNYLFGDVTEFIKK